MKIALILLTLLTLILSCSPKNDSDTAGAHTQSLSSESKRAEPASDKIVIINPCKAKAKLSMVKPVEKILIEEFDFPVIVLHYTELGELTKLNPQIVIITGQSTPWQEYDLSKFNTLYNYITEYQRPTLGICGGHQLIALLFGGAVGLLDPSSCDISLGYRGCKKAKGYVAVSIVEESFLFTGYKRETQFYASHCEEITRLPEGFIRLATTTFSKEYAIAHQSLPLYGVQFHPELPANANSHGKAVLRNFVNHFTSIQASAKL